MIIFNIIQSDWLHLLSYRVW